MKDKAASYAALEGLTSVHLDFIRYNDAVLGRRLNSINLRFSKIPIVLNMILAIIRWQ